MLSVAKTIITTVVVRLYNPIVLTELLWGVWQSSDAAVTQPQENSYQVVSNTTIEV